jgi:hypothetical protein
MVAMVAAILRRLPLSAARVQGMLGFVGQSAIEGQYF